jgi:hypothetical protein
MIIKRPFVKIIMFDFKGHLIKSKLEIENINDLI